MNVLAVFAAFLTIQASAGKIFSLDRGPCNLSPDFPMTGIPPPDAVAHVDIPKACRNGTLFWDYPSGHVYMHYNNEKRQDTRICFSDELGGNILTVVDLSTTFENELPRVESFTKKKVCTQMNNSKKLLLRIDAPQKITYWASLVFTVE